MEFGEQFVMIGLMILMLELHVELLDINMVPRQLILMGRDLDTYGWMKSIVLVLRRLCLHARETVGVQTIVHILKMWRLAVVVSIEWKKRKNQTVIELIRVFKRNQQQRCL